MFESKKLSRLLVAPFSVWAVIFIVLPLFFVLYHGLTDGAGTFTAANLGEVFSWEYMSALGLSVELALVSTVLCLVLAYPLCLILTSMKRGKMVLIFVLFLLPLWMNSLL
ncbi:MAG: ABC transporter permease, partial [Selenomonas sp.]|nr:ABC transporter permease [Selenomonas sp.]